jgi:peptide/nickel transport system substrate-binding protein
VLAEMWRAVGLNVDMQMKENWQQISIATARGRAGLVHSAPFNDPVSSIVNQRPQRPAAAVR